jgi:hypothetical protein
VPGLYTNMSLVVTAFSIIILVSSVTLSCSIFKNIIIIITIVVIINVLGLVIILLHSGMSSTNSKANSDKRTPHRSCGRKRSKESNSTDRDEHDNEPSPPKRPTETSKKGNLKYM